MSGKFTPGPWVWTEDRYGQRSTLRQSGSGAVVLDPQADVSDFGLRWDRWSDVSDEDAALIASAPAMHAALEAAERLFNEALPKFDWGKSALDGNAIQLLNEVPGQVRAALALSHPLEEKS